jgi:hypothetical protein
LFWLKTTHNYRNNLRKSRAKLEIPCPFFKKNRKVIIEKRCKWRGSCKAKHRRLFICCTGYWFLDAGCWMLDAGYWMLVSGCWFLDTGFWILDAGNQTIYRTPHIKDRVSYINMICPVYRGSAQNHTSHIEYRIS